LIFYLLFFFFFFLASSLGGLPGMMLTMSDIGGEHLGITGPPGTRPFIAR
jgi:hypothetical protein